MCVQQAADPNFGIYRSTNIKRENEQAFEICYVVDAGGTPIMGRTWLRALGMWPLNWKKPEQKREQNVQNIDVNTKERVDKLESDFSDVFAPGLDSFTKGTLKLALNEDAQPKFFQPRSLPIIMREKVENELARLIENKRIVSIDYSDWGTPIVPILKSEAEVRLCGDYKITVNKYLKVNHHPLSRPEAMFNTLRGTAVYTKLDLSEAFQQYPLDEESQKLTVISTHMGLLKYLYLPFGLSTGPGSFQKAMEALLLDIPVLVVFIDDILIGAPDTQILEARVRVALHRLGEAGLRLKFDKCIFFQDEVKYLGYKINSTGIQPLQNKIESVIKAPMPTNESELRSFLGSINYYSRYIYNFASKLRPLYDCLEKGKFEWTPECTKVVTDIKKSWHRTKFLYIMIQIRR